jgi:hypothetical protein
MAATSRHPRKIRGCLSLAQQLLQFLRQIALAVGLGQEVAAGGVGAVVLHRGFGEAGGVEDGEIWSPGLHGRSQLPAGHAAGHHDVGEDQGDILRAVQLRQRLLGVDGLERAVAEVAQLRYRGAPHLGVVFDH